MKVQESSWGDYRKKKKKNTLPVESWAKFVPLKLWDFFFLTSKGMKEEECTLSLRKFRILPKFCLPHWHSAFILKDNIFHIIIAYGKMNCQQDEGGCRERQRKRTTSRRGKFWGQLIHDLGLDLYLLMQTEFENQIVPLTQQHALKWLTGNFPPFMK